MKYDILYMTDNKIYFYDYKSKKKYKFKINKNIISMGRIINYDKFIIRYNNILKEINSNQGLFGNNIKIIINPSYYNIDILTLKNIFSYLNYRKIKVIYEDKLYRLNRNRVYLNLEDNYFIMGFVNDYKKRETKIINRNLFNSYEDLLKYIKYVVKNKTIFLIGSEKQVESFYELFEKKYKNITYMYSDSEFYLINAALK